MKTAPTADPQTAHANRSEAAHLPLSREEEARVCLSGTALSGAARRVLIAGLVLLISAGGFAEWMAPEAGRSPARWKAWTALWPGPARWASVRTPADVWALLPEPRATRAAEKALEEGSPLARSVRPGVQQFLTGVLREGNGQVRVGRGLRRLFFRKDCEFVEGPGFADPTWIARRRLEGIAGDAAAGVLDFHRRLAARGIALVVLPVPVKPMVEGHGLWGGPERLRANRSYSEWVEGLRAGGVEVVDIAQDLVERGKASGKAQYLQTDTHWRPETMGAVAARVAERAFAVGQLREAPGTESGSAGGGGAPVRGAARSVSAHGDTLALLGLPREQRLFAQETVEITPVSLAGRVWKADPAAEVLVLGDSFTNIYSLGAMGWGESAGFAEQLSVELGRPVDVIARNSDGASATRAILRRELAAGRDRLRGKRVVVWEFAARELAFGDWRAIPLEVGEAREPTFFVPPQGERFRVQGTVAEISSIPQPESVPYREHIVSLRLVDVVNVVEMAARQPETEAARQMLVYAWSIRERELTAVSRLRPGDRVAFEVRAWEEVAGELEKFQRSEFADPLLAVEPAAWGELSENATPGTGSAR